MTCPKRLILLLTLVCLALPAHASRPNADVITMLNGDIHIGKVKQESFRLQTVFGTLFFGIDDIGLIKPRSKSSSATIITLAGEHIKGELSQTSIEISRLQDPDLPIDLEDVSQIDFGMPDQATQHAGFTSKLQTRSGDTLYVRPAQNTLKLRTETDTVSIDLSDLSYLDAVLRTDEDTISAQATRLNGGIIQGEPVDDLLFSCAYQADIRVSAKHISRLTLPLANSPVQDTDSFSDPIPRLGMGPKMIIIPGGQYLKGDHQGDGDFDEKPLAEVKLKSFAIGQFEITFAQYDLFCKQTRCNLPDDQEWGRGERPVMNVSWEQAFAYTEWLSEKTGKHYRLPSDAEWEYAHRAGEMTRYSWGNAVESARANCEGCGSLWDGDQTAPVGRFSANAFGLHDTAGNVFEWVADCFHDRFADAPSDGSPIEKPGCGKRVIRGGAWSFPPHEIRSANRWRDFPRRRSDDTGFRVAMDL